MFDCTLVIINSAVLADTLDGAAGAFDVGIVTSIANMSVTLDDAVAAISCKYDIAVKRVVSRQAEAAQQDAAQLNLNTSAVANPATFNIVLAPTQSNALMTDVVGARALGERILAGQATQPVTTSFTTFLGGDWPLAEAGQLVEVNGERAIINGVSISVEFGKVVQSITLGEQTTNAYSKLMSLLPAQPLLVGNVIANYGDTTVLSLLDGGVIMARGTGAVGLNYYVRNGLIESAAPNLALSEIVI